MGKVKGLSGSTLKIIAMISMLIDHTAAVLLYTMEIKVGYTEELNTIYIIMRYVIGRLAFPIYCFLLVEGFEKTRSRVRYGARLLLFAFLSEIPFNLAFRGRAFDLSYQNVFFTLFIGLLMIGAMTEIGKKEIAAGWKVAGNILIFLAAAFGAEAFRCDYGAYGMIAIGMLFGFRKNRIRQMIAGCVSFLWEITAPLAFIFVGFYNGQRGLKLKYAFYVFYPLHLLILYCLSRLLFG